MTRARSLRRSAAAAPHIVWSVLFIVAPLLFVLYYAFTDKDGSFSFANILDLFTADSEFHLFAVVITAEYGKYSNRANLAAKLIDSGIIAKLGNKLFFFSYCIDKVAGLNSCFKCGRLRLN